MPNILDVLTRVKIFLSPFDAAEIQDQIDAFFAENPARKVVSAVTTTTIDANHGALYLTVTVVYTEPVYV